MRDGEQVVLVYGWSMAGGEAGGGEGGEEGRLEGGEKREGEKLNG